MKNVLTAEDIEFRKQIHIRNLKRKLAKLSTHAELTEEYLELKKHVENLESVN